MFSATCGTQWRKRLQRFLSHVFQLGFSFFSFHFPRQREKIQMTNTQIWKPFRVSPAHLTPGFVLACWTVPLQKALTQPCDTYYFTLCSSSKDWFQHTASPYDSRYQIPFSYPVNLYSSCLYMLASGAIDWVFLQISWRVLQWHLLIQVFLESFQSLTGQRKQTAASNMPNNKIQKIGASFKICIEHLLIWQIA